MADFLDSEAEESEEEQELNDVERKKLKKMKALDSDDEDDEEDDEERIREELKDLIDDNPIEEDESDDGGDSDIGGSKKRKKSDDEDDYDDRLEDDDYELLEENLGVKMERKKQFKRLRRIQDEESDDDQVEQNEGDERDAIANELFDHSDNLDREEMDEDRSSDRAAHQRSEADHYDEEGSEGEYSDADDFIVDDDGRPIAERRKRRKPIFTDAALQEAQDIFGVDFDYDEFSKYDDYEEESEEDDEYLDEEEGEEGRKRREKKATRKKPSRKSIFEIYEPSELKRGHFTDVDNEIRMTDLPERMQLRSVPVTKVPKDSPELEEEAEWVYKQAFCKPTISVQDACNAAERERAKKGPQAVSKIKQALDYMRNENFEVPFIAFYRKEYVQPELNINDLWKIYKFDEKWCQLKSRKTNLTRLFEKMRDYQAEELMKNIDQPIADSVRVVKDEDIDRLKKVQTMEELRDIYQHFMLYYSHEIPAMQEAYRKKEREEAKEKRRQERLARRAERGEGEEGAEDEDIIEEEPPEEEEEPQVEDETPKQASRGGTYALCRKAGLDGLAKKFGLSPEQFAENLRDNYQRHEIEQEPQEPSMVADEFRSNIFKTSEEILMAAKYMVAIQLSREPLVRSCMRETYFERAKITIKPTKKGHKEIDENHPCYSVKYVKNKPVRDLNGDQFLKLHMAEQERLITIIISEDMEGMTSSSYLEEIKQLYNKDEFSKSVQDWNDLRMECVDLAMKKLLIPALRTELRERLLAEAKENVLKACCYKLYNQLRVAPYATDITEEDEEDDWDASKGLRVLSIAYVPDFTQAAFACVVGTEGDVLEFLRLPNLMKRKNGWREEDKLQKEADLLGLKNLIMTKKPHVVVVGGESREAIMVQADVQEILSNLQDEETFPSGIKVEILDNEMAKVFANSIKGSTEFRDYPHLLRQAVSLARRMQDPLIEFSQLCSPDEEILCLRFHALQEQISKEELLDALYLEFVNRTNEVGVDLNRAIQEPHTSNLVQFVCGLGPRKGAALMKTLKQINQRLENRTQLVTVCHMAPIVFINCAGFIKIDTNSLGDSTESYVEVLDGSRVHPETYEWARKMAVDALEYDDEDVNPAGALEEILESPDRLKDLDLDAFAEELERQNFGNRSITLYDIRAELNHRYKDLRDPYTSPNPEELFDMLTKETPETFFIGKLIMATVCGITHRKPQGEQLDQANPVRNDETGLWQCPFCLKNDFPELSEVWNHFDAGGCPGQATGIRLRFDNGISGYIPIKNLSDNHVTNPEERVRNGQIIHCRIVKIEVDRFSVECTSRSSDLLDKSGTWRPPKDPYYDNDSEESDIKTEEDSKKAKHRQSYVKRVIVHPSFHNISYPEAEKMMANMDQGDCIVRPSSKGSDHLTVTWKVGEGIYQHIDVREEGKENAFSLGQSLWIDNLEFEDLDEIIARHVTPMAALVRDVLSFKYHRDFDGGKRDKAEAALAEEREKNKNKIHYFLSASKEFPGKFLLSYMPRNRSRHEYITVTPDGFRYRRQMFDSLSGLMRWFKEHFRDPVPGTPSTPRGSMTNRTPFANHTPTMNMSSMNAEAIHRVAQSMPSHMLHSLSQVANQTPAYPHTPGGAGFAGAPAYGAFANTPYTPSGQTPYMTPYQTPHTQQTPRYGQQTPSHSGGFLHPGAVTPGHRTPSSHSRPPSQQGSSSRAHGSHSGTPTHHGTPTYRSSGGPHPSGSNDPTDWKKAAEEWAKLKQRETGWATPRSDGRSTPRGTPRYDDGRGTPRSYDGRASRGPMDGRSPRLGTPRMGTGTPRIGTPRSQSGRESVRSTPRTNTSPHSMVESSLGGDATPLYDEN